MFARRCFIYRLFKFLFCLSSTIVHKTKVHRARENYCFNFIKPNETNR